MPKSFVFAIMTMVFSNFEIAILSYFLYLIVLCLCIVASLERDFVFSLNELFIYCVCMRKAIKCQIHVTENISHY